MASHFYGFLADVVLVAHFALVVFLVGGFFAVWLGRFLGWGWVRNRRFRVLHVATMGVVALLAAFDWFCPLTLWEDELRTRAAGTAAYGREGFIASWLGRVLYYHFPMWVFAVTYAAFFLLVLATWIAVRPKKGS